MRQSWASQVMPAVKNLPCQSRRSKTQVWYLGWENPLEEELATHSSILAWKTPWTEEPNRLQGTGSQRIGHDWAQTHTHTHSLIQAIIPHQQTKIIFEKLNKNNWMTLPMPQSKKNISNKIQHFKRSIFILHVYRNLKKYWTYAQYHRNIIWHNKH